MFTGSLYELEKDSNPQQQYVEWEKQYGETYGLFEGGNKTIVTSDLEILNDVFIRKFENFHGRKVHSKNYLTTCWVPVLQKYYYWNILLE